MSRLTNRLSYLFVSLFFVVRNILQHFNTFCSATYKEVYSIKYVMQNLLSSLQYTKREIEVLETDPDHDRYDPAEEECWVASDPWEGYDPDEDPYEIKRMTDWDEYNKQREAEIQRWCEENPGKDPFSVE